MTAQWHAPPPSVTPCPHPLHRAIVFNRLSGIKDQVYEEGTHLMVPWFERPIIYDVRCSAAAATGWVGQEGSSPRPPAGQQPPAGCLAMTDGRELLQARSLWQSAAGRPSVNPLSPPLCQPPLLLPPRCAPVPTSSPPPPARATFRWRVAAHTRTHARARVCGGFRAQSAAEPGVGGARRGVACAGGGDHGPPPSCPPHPPSPRSTSASEC